MVDSFVVLPFSLKKPLPQKPLAAEESDFQGLSTCMMMQSVTPPEINSPTPEIR